MNILNETPESAAIRLCSHKIAEGFLLEAMHAYKNEANEILYWRLRFKHPETKAKYIPPMKFDGVEGYDLKEPAFDNGKPLYNLPLIINNPEAPIFVVEGESCADKLSHLGLVATTSGSYTSALSANWQPLKSREVVVWRDYDKVGFDYAVDVTNSLCVFNCSVQWIDVEQLNLPPKADAVDWLNAHPSATMNDVLALPKIDAKGLVISNMENNDEDGNAKQSQASALVNFVLSRSELFHDKNAEVYAQDLASRETRRLDSRNFKDWLVANFHESTGQSPRDQSLREAISTLGGLARYKGQCYEVHVRVAVDNGSYYLDLGEPGQSRAIQIMSGKWELISDPPVHFLRPETLQPLPEPLRNGDFSKLWGIINIPKNGRLLLITWLMECLRPETPFPLLELIGEQGSAKSTTQSMLRSLIDPNACNLRAAPKTVEDIFVSAGVNWLVSYENISYLSPATQDALCVLATGGGFAKRKLYSDAEESVISVKRPAVLNGISATVTAQDLIDRTISIETPVITNRMQVTDLWNDFESERPRILGAILDTFAQALSLLNNVELLAADRPRLAEFAHLGMAVAQALGSSSKEFLDQFNAGRQEAIARTIDANPVASALIEWFENVRGKQKTILPIKVLFEQVGEKRSVNSESWPRSPKGFADALRRAAPALRQMGIECRSLGKVGSYVSWEIKQRE